MRPSAALLAPSEARSTGIVVVAISWPTSENRPASPMPSTVELSQQVRVGEGAGGGEWPV